jgi:hypothetical protein
MAMASARLGVRVLLIGLVSVLPPAAPAAAHAPAHGARAIVAAYDFDATPAGESFSDGSGNQHLLSALTRSGGALRTVEHGAGRAVLFPAVCAQRKCPRLVLETASTPALNPGTRPLRFGATVRLAADQTTDGQNILQKGYSATGGQYKLQVDKAAGRPSCVLTSEGSGTIHLAWSSVSIADGAWHGVQCRRTGTRLAILVDGIVRGRTTVPAGLTVDNAAPLVLGGKGLGRNSDQFQGALDDAWVTVGP